MKEDKKKFSLLTNLYNILFNNYVNNHVFEYEFRSMSTLVINDVDFDVSGTLVNIILYLDELIVEIHGETLNTYSLPYNLIKEVCILLEDENDRE